MSDNKATTNNAVPFSPIGKKIKQSLNFPSSSLTSITDDNTLSSTKSQIPNNQSKQIESNPTCKIAIKNETFRESIDPSDQQDISPTSPNKKRILGEKKYAVSTAQNTLVLPIRHSKKHSTLNDSGLSTKLRQSLTPSSRNETSTSFKPTELNGSKKRLKERRHTPTSSNRIASFLGASEFISNIPNKSQDPDPSNDLDDTKVHSTGPTNKNNRAVTPESNSDKSRIINESHDLISKYRKGSNHKKSNSSSIVNEIVLEQSRQSMVDSSPYYTLSEDPANPNPVLQKARLSTLTVNTSLVNNVSQRSKGSSASNIASRYLASKLKSQQPSSAATIESKSLMSTYRESLSNPLGTPSSLSQIVQPPSTAQTQRQATGNISIIQVSNPNHLKNPKIQRSQTNTSNMFSQAFMDQRTFSSINTAPTEECFSSSYNNDMSPTKKSKSASSKTSTNLSNHLYTNFANEIDQSFNSTKFNLLRQNTVETDGNAISQTEIVRKIIADKFLRTSPFQSDQAISTNYDSSNQKFQGKIVTALKKSSANNSYKCSRRTSAVTGQMDVLEDDFKDLEVETKRFSCGEHSRLQHTTVSTEGNANTSPIKANHSILKSMTSGSLRNLRERASSKTRNKSSPKIDELDSSQDFTNSVSPSSRGLRNMLTPTKVHQNIRESYLKVQKINSSPINDSSIEIQQDKTISINGLKQKYLNRSSSINYHVEKNRSNRKKEKLAGSSPKEAYGERIDKLEHISVIDLDQQDHKVSLSSAKEDPSLSERKTPADIALNLSGHAIEPTNEKAFQTNPPNNERSRLAAKKSELFSIEPVIKQIRSPAWKYTEEDAYIESGRVVVDDSGVLKKQFLLNDQFGEQMIHEKHSSDSKSDNPKHLSEQKILIPEEEIIMQKNNSSVVHDRDVEDVIVKNLSQKQPEVHYSVNRETEFSFKKPNSTLPREKTAAKRLNFEEQAHVQSEEEKPIEEEEEFLEGFTTQTNNSVSLQQMIQESKAPSRENPHSSQLHYNEKSHLSQDASSLKHNKMPVEQLHQAEHDLQNKLESPTSKEESLISQTQDELSIVEPQQEIVSQEDSFIPDKNEESNKNNTNNTNQSNLSEKQNSSLNEEDKLHPEQLSNFEGYPLQEDFNFISNTSDIVFVEETASKGYPVSSSQNKKEAVSNQIQEESVEEEDFIATSQTKEKVYSSSPLKMAQRSSETTLYNSHNNTELALPLLINIISKLSTTANEASEVVLENCEVENISSLQKDNQHLYSSENDNLQSSSLQLEDIQEKTAETYTTREEERIFEVNGDTKDCHQELAYIDSALSIDLATEDNQISTTTKKQCTNVLEDQKDILNQQTEDESQDKGHKSIIKELVTQPPHSEENLVEKINIADKNELVESQSETKGSYNNNDASITLLQSQAKLSPNSEEESNSENSLQPTLQLQDKSDSNVKFISTNQETKSQDSKELLLDLLLNNEIVTEKYTYDISNTIQRKDSNVDTELLVGNKDTIMNQDTTNILVIDEKLPIQQPSDNNTSPLDENKAYINANQVSYLQPQIESSLNKESVAVVQAENVQKNTSEKSTLQFQKESVLGINRKAADLIASVHDHYGEHSLQSLHELFPSKMLGITTQTQNSSNSDEKSVLKPQSEASPEFKDEITNLIATCEPNQNDVQVGVLLEDTNTAAENQIHTTLYKEEEPYLQHRKQLFSSDRNDNLNETANIPKDTEGKIPPNYQTQQLIEDDIRKEFTLKSHVEPLLNNILAENRTINSLTENENSISTSQFESVINNNEQLHLQSSSESSSDNRTVTKYYIEDALTNNKKSALQLQERQSLDKKTVKTDQITIFVNDNKHTDHAKLWLDDNIVTKIQTENNGIQSGSSKIVSPHKAEQLLESKTIKEESEKMRPNLRSQARVSSHQKHSITSPTVIILDASEESVPQRLTECSSNKPVTKIDSQVVQVENSPIISMKMIANLKGNSYPVEIATDVLENDNAFIVVEDEERISLKSQDRMILEATNTDLLSSFKKSSRKSTEEKSHSSPLSGRIFSSDKSKIIGFLNTAPDFLLDNEDQNSSDLRNSALLAQKSRSLMLGLPLGTEDDSEEEKISNYTESHFKQKSTQLGASIFKTDKRDHEDLSPIAGDQSHISHANTTDDHLDLHEFEDALTNLTKAQNDVNEGNSLQSPMSNKYKHTHRFERGNIQAAILAASKSCNNSEDGDALTGLPKFMELVGRAESFSKLDQHKEAIDILQEMYSEINAFEPEEEEKVNKEVLKLYVSNFLCVEYFHITNYVKSLEWANNTLKHDSFNLQALYKAYQCERKRGNNELARDLLKKVRKIISSPYHAFKTQNTIVERLSIPSLTSSMTNVSVLESHDSFCDDNEKEKYQDFKNTYNPSIFKKYDPSSVNQRMAEPKKKWSQMRFGMSSLQFMNQSMTSNLPDMTEMSATKEIESRKKQFR